MNERISSLKTFFLIFFLVNLFLSAYFIDIWLTPNSVSRALPLLSLHEQNSIIIDKYQQYTGDKAVINNHYYSDKAPLSTFFVYPFYAAFNYFFTGTDTTNRFNKHPIYIWEAANLKDGRSFFYAPLVFPLA